MNDKLRVGLGYCAFWIVIMILYVSAGFIFIMNVGVLSDYATFMLQEVKPTLDNGGELGAEQLVRVLSFGKELQGVLLFLPLFLLITIGLYSLARTTKEAFILNWWKRYWLSFSYYYLSWIVFMIVIALGVGFMIPPTLLLLVVIFGMVVMYLQGIVATLLLTKKMDLVWPALLQLKKVGLYSLITFIVSCIAVLIFGLTMMVHFFIGVIIVVIYLGGYILKQHKHYVLLREVR